MPALGASSIRRLPVTPRSRGVARVALGAVLAAGLLAPAGPPRTPGAPPGPERAIAVPAPALLYEANVGQTDPEVAFLARGREATLFLTRGEAVWRARGGGVLRQRLAGADAAAAVEGAGRIGGSVNYYGGDDPARWRTGVPAFARVAYRQVYPGIDAVFHSAGGQAEYDFVVAPGADPSLIGLVFDGASTIRVDGGDLVLGLGDGTEVRHRAPVVYQDRPAGRQGIEGRYQVDSDGRVGFLVGAYDRTRPLVIDPVVVVYSTFLGGAGPDIAQAVAVDSGGHAIVTGYTQSADFPTRNPVRGSPSGLDDAFVTKLDPTGSGLVYSTYLGGGGNDAGRRVAVDAAGNAYVAGTAGSGFPTTAGAFQVCQDAATADAFVAKLTPEGALAYSTCLGGNEREEGLGIAVDRSGHAFVAGFTNSTNLPLAGPFQATRLGTRDGFVAKLNPTGTGLVYSTYLGGSNLDMIQALALDTGGHAYVTGLTGSSDFPMAGTPYDSTYNGLGDVFVAKLHPAGSSLVYATYLGGTRQDGRGTAMSSGIAVDRNGRVTVADQTESSDFPVTAGAFLQAFRGGKTDLFVARLDASGSRLEYSTYLGGSGDDGAYAVVDVAVDPSGAAFVAGQTSSTDFPLSNAFDDLFLDGEGFVTKLNPWGTALVYSTLVGGSRDDGSQGFAVALDADGSAYLTGFSRSPNYPTTEGAYQRTPAGDPNNIFTFGDAVITKVDPFLGFLRVTTSPALPSQVTVDGVPRATWGTVSLEATPGTHEVCFRAVEGFTTPACQSVTVNNGAVTTVAGNFAARGFLQVVTNPALPGTVAVNGVPRDEWGIYTDLPPGSYTVCFGAVAGFVPPACRNVSVTAGQTTTVTGNYTASAGAPPPAPGKGFLRVTTSPALPSQISVDGTPRGTWGLINLPLDPGEHTVCFRDVEGYVTPACRSVTVTAGQTTQTEGAFAPKGFLQVVTSPALPAAIYVDGIARDDWGIFTDLPTGTHEVCFGAVNGYEPPACQTVNLTGPTVTVTGTYLPT